MIHRKHQRYTTDSFVEKCKNIHGEKYDYSKVQYLSAQKKVEISCNSCGYKWATLPSNHLNGKGCKNCAVKLLPQNQGRTHDEFLKLAKEVHGDKFVYMSKYISDKKPITLKCKICNNTLKQRAGSHLYGYGCKYCQYKLLPQNRPMAIEEFESRCKKVHENKYTYFQDFTGVRNKNKISILCPIHGVFKQGADAHLLKGQGCPKCNMSRGEKRIATYLKNNNIQYEQEKKFVDFKGKNKNSRFEFDFFLPRYNLIIEYDGEHHYYPILAFGGQKYLTQMKFNDNLKNQYCKDKGIELVRIPFFDYNDIETILEKVFHVETYKLGISNGC